MHVVVVFVDYFHVYILTKNQICFVLFFRTTIGFVDKAERDKKKARSKEEKAAEKVFTDVDWRTIPFLYFVFTWKSKQK